MINSHKMNVIAVEGHNPEGSHVFYLQHLEHLLSDRIFKYDRITDSTSEFVICRITLIEQ